MGGTTTDAMASPLKVTLKIWYGRYNRRPGRSNHRQSHENLGDSGTTADYSPESWARWYNCRSPMVQPSLLTTAHLRYNR
ncbi:hypothetical protein GW17_00054880 [Ensete ventricosum]|nr:hypothetical protein GW17_00054880 [Ensete ventricosum]